MVRIKHRYLLLNILFPGDSPATFPASFRSAKPSPLALPSPTPPHFSAASLVNLIRESVAEHFGDYGVGVTAGLKVIYFSPATSTAIVRCPRASYRFVWAGLTYVGSLPGARRGAGGSAQNAGCVIRVVRVSGTIRKAEEEAVRRARMEIVRVKMLDQEGGDENGLDSLLHGGPGGAGALDRNDEDAGIEDTSDGGEDMDDDSG